MPDNKQLIERLRDRSYVFAGLCRDEAADTIERLEEKEKDWLATVRRVEAERERDAAVLEALTSDEPITRLSEVEANSAASFAGVVSNELYGRGPLYMRAKVRSAIQTALQHAQEQVGEKPEFSCSGVEAQYVEDESKRLGIECDMPPVGWRCTRPKGHDGPCAALPVGVSADQEGKG